MTRFVVPALALVLATAPGLLDAQQRGGGGRGGGMQINPIQSILNNADSLQLNLTADQRTRLDGIRTDLDAANAPRLAELQAARGGGTPDMATLQQTMAAIQEANNAAVTRARGVLTAEQITKVEPFLESLTAGRRGGGGRGGARGGGGAPPPPPAPGGAG